MTTLPNAPSAAGRAREPECDLVRKHLPLVDHAVARLAARLPRHVSAGDLTSAGLFGLFQAARAYDPDRGVPFEQWAASRIRGALLDELRGLDWASRSVRARAREMERTTERLATDLGRKPDPAEVGAAMGLSAEEVASLVNDVHRATVVHYDCLVFSAVDERLPPGSQSPEDVVLHAEELGYLRDAVAALPERLQLVVTRYFLEERPMVEIAVDLGVTESRVSQMRAEALTLLRHGINAQLEPESVPDEARPPTSVVSRRRAAYYAAIASSSDYRTRIEAGADVLAAPFARSHSESSTAQGAVRRDAELPPADRQSPRRLERPA